MDLNAEPTQGVHVDRADKSRADHGRAELAENRCTHRTQIH
jgi:hypothetical protein